MNHAKKLAIGDECIIDIKQWGEEEELEIFYVKTKKKRDYKKLISILNQKKNFYLQIS